MADDGDEMRVSGRWGGIWGHAASVIGRKCVENPGLTGQWRENTENLQIFAIFSNFLVDTCGLRWFNEINRRRCL